MISGALEHPFQGTVQSRHSALKNATSIMLVRRWNFATEAFRKPSGKQHETRQKTVGRKIEKSDGSRRHSPTVGADHGPGKIESSARRSGAGFCVRGSVGFRYGRQKRRRLPLVIGNWRRVISKIPTRLLGPCRRHESGSSDFRGLD